MDGNLNLLREWGKKYNIDFPEKDEDLLNIEELDISDKGIEYIPPQLNLLTKLSKLIIKNNPISELPDEFEEIESLEIFDYRNTPLIGTFPPIPSSVYGCVVDEETADYVYRRKPESYFLPVYIFGYIENRLVIVQYSWAYDLIEQRKAKDDSINVPTVYQVMQKYLKPKIIKKFGVQINEKNKKDGVYFRPEDEIAVKEFIWEILGWDPMLCVENNQEMIEKAAGILE
jgi:hypothetical protein